MCLLIPASCVNSRNCSRTIRIWCISATPSRMCAVNSRSWTWVQLSGRAANQNYNPNHLHTAAVQSVPWPDIRRVQFAKRWPSVVRGLCGPELGYVGELSTARESRLGISGVRFRCRQADNAQRFVRYRWPIDIGAVHSQCGQAAHFRRCEWPNKVVPKLLWLILWYLLCLLLASERNGFGSYWRHRWNGIHSCHHQDARIRYNVFVPAVNRQIARITHRHHTKQIRQICRSAARITYRNNTVNLAYTIIFSVN